MKKLLFFLLIGINMNAMAQYFDHYYEPTKVGSGVRTSLTSEGHLLAGIHNGGDLTITKTDATGGFSGTDFNKAYHFTYQGHNATITGSEALEYNSGTGYAVVATFSTTYSEYGIFFVRISTNGTPSNLSCWTFGTELTVNSICESTTYTSDIFATGNVGTEKVFATRIDSLGNMIWGYVYSTKYGWVSDGNPPTNPNPMRANDIIQTPYYDSVFGGYPLVLVGGIYDHSFVNNSIDWNGLWMWIDPSNGYGLPNNLYDDLSANIDEEFRGIISTDSGYIVCGYAKNSYAYNTAWLLKIQHESATTFPNVIWSTLHPTTITNTNENPLYDLKYRATGNAVYAIGKDNDNQDNFLILYKFNAFDGTLSSATQYQRGSNQPFLPVSLDLNNDATTGGVSLYSYGFNNVTSNVAANIQKVYFNGVYPCTYDGYTPGAGVLTTETYLQSAFGEDFEASEIVNTTSYNLSDQGDCYADDVQGGSNSLTGNKQININKWEVAIYPNPASLNSVLYVERTKGKWDDGVIKLFDITGKELMTVDIDIANDKQLVPLMNLPQGLYLLRIQSAHNNESKLITIK